MDLSAFCEALLSQPSVTSHVIPDVHDGHDVHVADTHDTQDDDVDDVDVDVDADAVDVDASASTSASVPQVIQRIDLENLIHFVQIWTDASSTQLVVI